MENFMSLAAIEASSSPRWSDFDTVADTYKKLRRCRIRMSREAHDEKLSPAQERKYKTPRRADRRGEIAAARPAAHRRWSTSSTTSTSRVGLEAG